MDYLEKGSTSDQRIDVGYHMPGTEIRASAHRHGSAGAHLTHLLDHESPPDPRRLPEFSRPVAVGSSCISRERPSRLPAGTSRSHAAVRRLAAGFLLGFAALLAPLPAAAQNIHSTTITVASSGNTSGYLTGTSGYGSITDGTFTYNSVDYTFNTIHLNVSGNLNIRFNNSDISGLSNVYFYVAGIAFAVADKTGDSNSGDNKGWYWRNADEDGLSWSTGETVTIAVEQTELTTTLSSDATLSALTLTDFNGEPVTLNETFDSNLLTYTVSVTNDDTEVTVTPTLSDANATIEYLDGLGAELTDADGSLNGFQVFLDPGDNVFGVKVTAEDRTTTKTYMVTVTRATTTDTAVTIEAEYASIGGGLEDLDFTLTRAGETTDALAVKVTIVQAQAWLGNSDLEHDVTFLAGSATAELTITASKFSFTPSTAGDLTATVTGDGIDGGSDMVAIISTSGPPITASYDMPAYTFAEDATDEAIYLVVTLDAAYPRAFAIDAGSFSSRSGTATSPEDFVAYSKQNVVSPGEFTRDVDTDPLVARTLIQDFIVDDAIYEGSESFVMKIEAGPGLSADLLQFAYPDGTTCAPYSCSPGVEYEVTITDEGDLPVLSLSVDPSSIAEEDDDGTTSVAENVSTVTVEITNGKTFAVDQTATLTFSGTATQGTHYSVSPGDADTNTAGHQVVLPKETASVEVTVTATANDTDDGPRTVTVAADLDGTAIGSRGITILDDDTTTPTTVPGAATSLTATASGTTTIDLSWTAPLNNGGSVITVKSRVVCKSERKLLDASVRLPWRPPSVREA